MNYCAIPAGVLASAASVSGQTVIFYGEDAVTPAGINIGYTANISDYSVSVDDGSNLARFLFDTSSRIYFTDGTIDMSSASNADFGWGIYKFGSASSPTFGAAVGDQNYANMSFNGRDNVYEAVAQFSFDGVGGGYLVAVAFENTVENPNTTDLSLIGGTSTYAITDGAAAIAAASVPEPSSVALLALGATGLLMRRQRKAA